MKSSRPSLALSLLSAFGALGHSFKDILKPTQVTPVFRGGTPPRRTKMRTRIEGDKLATKALNGKVGVRHYCGMGVAGFRSTRHGE